MKQKMNQTQIQDKRLTVRWAGLRTVLYPWNALQPRCFRRRGNVTAAFTALGLDDFRAAAGYIARLPYGRNTNREHVLAVLREHRGTCSTKHALLCRLAIEQELNAKLLIGIYLMNGRNTPGARKVLEKYGIARIPEAHCYLRYGRKRGDVTRGAVSKVLPVVHEEEISPEQIGSYKIELHRGFLLRWANENADGCKYEVEELWRIREECIAALASS
jgi:hypothetical protein